MRFCGACGAFLRLSRSNSSCVHSSIFHPELWRVGPEDARRGGEQGGGPDIGDYTACRLTTALAGPTPGTLRSRLCPSISASRIGRLRGTWPGQHAYLVRPRSGGQASNSLAYHDHVHESGAAIYMDGRPHPSQYAAHTREGFSTGQGLGHMLKVETTHLKEGCLRRNGLPRSEKATITEYFLRHGDYLTVVTIVKDPVFLTEPFIRTSNWILNPATYLLRKPAFRATNSTGHPAGSRIICLAQAPSDPSL